MVRAAEAENGQWAERIPVGIPHVAPFSLPTSLRSPAAARHVAARPWNLTSPQSLHVFQVPLDGRALLRHLVLG